MKKVLKVLVTMLCIASLAGCAKDVSSEKIEEFTGEAMQNKNMAALDYVLNEEKSQEDGIMVFSGNNENVNRYVQINAECSAYYFDFPGSDNNEFLDSKELFLKYDTTKSKDITITREELEEAFADFINENKKTGDGLGVTEFYYTVRCRSIACVNNKWQCGEWDTFLRSDTANLTTIIYDIENSVVKEDVEEQDVETETDFASKIKEYAKDKNVDDFLNICKFPLTINDEKFETKDGLITSETEIWTNSFVESINQADENNVLKMDGKYILTSSEYGTPNITFEKNDDSYQVTEIHQ